VTDASGTTAPEESVTNPVRLAVLICATHTHDINSRHNVMTEILFMEFSFSNRR
jgi:hypothetical protein